MSAPLRVFFIIAVSLATALGISSMLAPLIISTLKLISKEPK